MDFCTSAIWTISAFRRLDLQARRIVTVAGNGQKAYAGDGGAATRRVTEHAPMRSSSTRSDIFTSPSATTM
jgi:hypothetical protein